MSDNQTIAAHHAAMECNMTFTTPRLNTITFIARALLGRLPTHGELVSVYRALVRS